MKVIRLHACADLRQHDEPNPNPHQAEKIVRLSSEGVCGPDLHWFSEGEIGDAKLEHPLVLGHKVVGKTDDCQRVEIDPAISCGNCEYSEIAHPHSLGNKFEITTSIHGRRI
jgi:L-iditol 2-dehydrogenase